MKLSEKKQFTNEFDFRVLSLYQTLRFYRDTFNFPAEIVKPLDGFLDFLDRKIYHEIPTKNDIELLNEKYFVTVYYKEVL